jgi:PiT family inorganic phosphate transporter
MSGALLLVAFIIAVALAFDYINGFHDNGFHDAANSIATVVSTRVHPDAGCRLGCLLQLRRRLWLRCPDGHGQDRGEGWWVILGALAGAIIWNLLTWYFGIPSSSSHALIGGFSGAAVAKAG